MKPELSFLDVRSQHLGLEAMDSSSISMAKLLILQGLTEKELHFFAAKLSRTIKHVSYEVFWAGNWRKFKITIWVDGKQLNSDE
jgi:hypothetical protein